MRVLLLIIGLFLFFPVLYAQKNFEVKGEVVDSMNLPLAGATVLLNHGKDSLTSFSDNYGQFSISANIKDSFSLILSYTGMLVFQKKYFIKEPKDIFQLGKIFLTRDASSLDSVYVNAVRPILVKEDTVQYAAAAYKVEEGAMVQELIKKLPGVTVDEEGKMEAQGKKIEKVRVNGKDYFGGDAQLALQNLPADIVANIQVIDDYGEMANLSGVKTGDPKKILNINIQKNKNKGRFGNTTLAAGNKGRYIANLSANFFNEEQQFSTQATLGNTSANMSSNGSSNNNGGAAQAGGITVSKLIAFNYRDKWSDKLSVYGSYVFNSRDNEVQSSTYSQDFNPLNIRLTQRENNSSSLSASHRITWNMDYTLDSNTIIKFSPYWSLNTSSGNNNSSSQISRKGFFTLNQGNGSQKGNTPSYGAGLVMNHRLKKRGRNFSMEMNYRNGVNENERFSTNSYQYQDSSFTPINVRDTLQQQKIATENVSSNTSFKLSYLEPLDLKRSTFLELNASTNQSSTGNTKSVYDVPDPSSAIEFFNSRQSDRYNYSFTTKRFGLSVRTRKQKYNYSIGFQYQPTLLQGTSLTRKFSTHYANENWIPSARFVYNFSRNKTLTTTLDGSAREPGFFQLQPVADSTNLENVFVGNPNLKNEYTNRVATTYNYTDYKGTVLFINLAFDQTNDKIVSSRLNNKSGTGRTTTYVNTDGFYGYDFNASYTKPFAKRKFSSTLGVSANYDNNISFTDGLKTNGGNWNIRPNAVFRMDIPKRVDLIFKSTYIIYKTTTRYLQESKTTQAQTWQLSLSGKNYFKDLVFGYDFSKIINYNFGGSTRVNPSILGLSLEYKMLARKNLSMKFQAFDVFNKYAGLNRSIQGTTITDTRTSRLGRFFLLSVNYRLSKFGAGFKQAGGMKKAGNIRIDGFRPRMN